MHGDFLIEGANCLQFSFDRECCETNARYGKNGGRSDVKSLNDCSSS